MKTPNSAPEKILHAESMLDIASNQANDLINRAIAQSNELLKKANYQALTLINIANTQAEKLIETANLNKKKLLLKADSYEDNLLKNANASENNLLKQANSNEKDLIENAHSRERGLKKEADILAAEVKAHHPGKNNLDQTQAKNLVNEAGVQAKSLLGKAVNRASKLVTEANVQAKGLVVNADEQAKSLVNQADDQAKDLVQTAAVQAKNLVKIAAFQARDLINEAADQTKMLVRESAIQAKELIAEAAEMYIENKMNFLNTAAHEFRTPVTSLTMAVELAEKQEAKGIPLTSNFLKQIRGPLDRLSRIIFNLIEMSQMERKIMSLEFKKTSLTSLISDCVNEMKLHFPDFKIHFTKPAQDPDINLDPLRIYQVLTNIIENAVKYCGKSTIEISLQFLKDTARVEIRDQGPGISPEGQKKLFSTFHRGSTDTTISSNGLGLGLALCREILILHKGHIGVISSEGKGCTFYFELPLS